MKEVQIGYSFLLELKENIVNVLILEAPHVFRKFVKSLSNACSGPRGEFAIWEELEPYELAPQCCVMTDLFTIDLNSRKLSSALAKWLKTESTSPEMFIKTQEMKAKLTEWAGELAARSDFCLSYETEPDCAQLIKSLGICFADDSTTELEQLTGYLRLSQQYLGLECAFLVNAKRFFTHDELDQLYQFAFYRKLHIVLIENIEQRDFLCERIYIVDKDGCEIYDDAL